MSISYGAVSVGVTATLIAPSSSARKGLLVANNDTTIALFIGPDSSVTASNGMPIPAGGYLINSGTNDNFRGAWYGIVASGSVDVRYFNWTE
jgi:hypothetical protein